MQIETGIHNQFFSIGTVVKQPGREADIHQRHSPKMKNQPVVAAITVRIASVVTDRCAVTFCQ
jgi:hypothetical protein